MPRVPVHVRQSSQLAVALGLLTAVAIAQSTDGGTHPPSPPPQVASSVFGVPPFDAWVSAEEGIVLPTPTKEWPSFGILRFGDVVRVRACDPACDEDGAFAMLEPFGAVRMRRLAPMPRTDAALHSGPEGEFRHGRVHARRARAREAPNLDAPVVDVFGEGDELVFRTDEDVPGFLRRPDGLYVEADDVTPLEPSSFSGWHDPPDPFVFVVAETTLTHPDGSTTPLHRYDRLPMVHLLPGGRVRVEGGTVPRSAVRNGRARRRPSRVPEDARWVHVDLQQQVLTAYEGDRMVFGTLVSTGRTPGTTATGLFGVRRKLVFTTMKSAAAGDEYFVEGVRYVQYFHGSVALHAAYWHDRFGTPLSHGCVNLSVADARFLFEFSPGEVPAGWRAVNPEAAYGSSLFVRVERIRR